MSGVRVRLVLAGLCVAGAVAPSPAFAAPGDLDPAFAGDGTATTNFPVDVTASRVFVRPDGTTLVVGRSSSGNAALNQRLVFVRYRRDGELDQGFGPGGAVVPAVDVPPAAALIQPDGKVTVASSGADVARFNADGSLDQTFGSGGVTSVRPDPSFAVRSIDDGPDGSLFLLGTVPAAEGEPTYGLLKLRADGSVDASFGDGGFVAGPGGNFEQTRSLTVDQAGRAVLLTSLGTGTLRRLTPAGEPDPAFSEDGVTQIPFLTFANGLATRPGGGYVVGIGRPGEIPVVKPPGPAGTDLGAIAFTDTGELDPGFHGDGVTFAPAPGINGASARDVELAADGSILVAAGGDETSGRFVVVRFRADGDPDPGFGIDGGTVARFTGERNQLADISAGAEDRIVAAGTIETRRQLALSVASFGTPGPGDLDADGRLDGSDRCPDIRARRKPGCPFLDRQIEDFAYKRKSRFFVGEIFSDEFDCYGGRVKVRERRHGHDRLVGRDRAGFDGDFKVPAPPRPGSYYAIALPELEPQVGICARARSATIRIEPRS